MVDFFIGIIIGVIITMLIYFVRQSKQVTEFAEKVETVKTETKTVSKPDNKAVKYYSSPEYKRERKFLDSEAEKRRKRRG